LRQAVGVLRIVSFAPPINPTDTTKINKNDKIGIIRSFKQMGKDDSDTDSYQQSIPLSVFLFTPLVSLNFFVGKENYIRNRFYLMKVIPETPRAN
jgi:hypothetical protein